MQSYQRLDLTSIQDLGNILKLFENEKHITHVQVKDVQFQKHKKLFEEFQSKNPRVIVKIKNTKLEFKEDAKNRQSIPTLDLNSINSKSLTKSTRQLSIHQKNQSCKNLKNLQQFFTDRISGHLSSSKETERKSSSISPNTKTINLNLTTKNPLNQPYNPAENSKKTFFSSKKKDPYFIDFLGRQEFQTSRNYLKKKNSSAFNKTSSITIDNDKKKSITKKTPPTVSFISSEQLKKQSTSIHKEQQIIKQECQSMHIPVKYLLESNPQIMKIDTDRFKIHLSNRQNSKDNKKDGLESSRDNSFKKQLNQIVQSTDKNGFSIQKVNNEEVKNEDISIHLKNLINFCNQSIQKKEQSQIVQDSQEISKKVLIQQKENVENSKNSSGGKIIGSVEIKSLTFKGEDDNSENPETARFNQDESDFKKLNEVINQKKNGHYIDSQEPYFPIEQLAELKKIKLLESKSKSISPTNTNQEQLKNSFFEMSINNDFVTQLMNAKTKKNLKGQQVKIARLQINNMNMDKQIEKSVSEICSQIQVQQNELQDQGLKIEKECEEKLSIPLMKALFDNQLQYLCIANCNIHQNELCLSLHYLEYLDISGNKLLNLSIAKTCTNLQELQASSNQINNLEGLGQLKQLRILDLQGNKIQSFESLLLLKQNENIEMINLFDNMVAKYPNYKRFLQQILPKLEKIDNQDYNNLQVLNSQIFI